MSAFDALKTWNVRSENCIARNTTGNKPHINYRILAQILNRDWEIFDINSSDERRKGLRVYGQDARGR